MTAPNIQSAARIVRRLMLKRLADGVFGATVFGDAPVLVEGAAVGPDTAGGEA
jgi:hypothetical protein